MNKKLVSIQMQRCSAVVAQSLDYQVSKHCLELMRLAVAILMMFLIIINPLEAQQANSDLEQDEAVSQLLSEIEEKSRVRSVYGRDSKTKIGDVPFDREFTIVNQGNPWTLVRFDKPSVPGWVSRDFVELRRGIATVRANALNVRLGSSLNSRVMTKVYEGYTSRVLKEQNGFVQIKAPASFQVAIKSSLVGQGTSSNKSTWSSSVKREVPASANTVSQQNNSKPSVAPKTVAKPTVNKGATQGAGALRDAVDVKPLTKTTEEQLHKIAPGDAISLLVFGEPDLSIENVRVPQSGRVSFPLIGPVDVAGKTTTMVEKDVAVLLAQGYVRNPRLSITIFSYRPIFIRGAVQNTGAFPYAEGLTVAKAIALAGGTKNSAISQGVSISRDGVTLQDGLAVDSQYKVSSGDVISIAEEEGVGEDDKLYIYVHGEVSQPGEYVFRKGLTVEKAIVLASGFSLRASKSKITITRYAGREEDQEPDKLKRVKLYTPIEPGDVIDVGASWF